MRLHRGLEAVSLKEVHYYFFVLSLSRVKSPYFRRLFNLTVFPVSSPFSFMHLNAHESLDVPPTSGRALRVHIAIMLRAHQQMSFGPSMSKVLAEIARKPSKAFLQITCSP